MPNITFTEFTDQIIQNIKDYLPLEYRCASIRVVHPPKPGREILTGICIHIPDTSISPILYLNDSYQSYCHGEPLPHILKRFSQTIAGLNLCTDAPEYLQWEKAKDCIAARLINICNGENDAYLAELPVSRHPNGRLGTVYDIVLPPTDEENPCIPVTNSLMERWGITLKELEALSRINTPRLRPASIFSLNRLLIQELPEEYADIPQAADIMFIVTNARHVHGAIAATYEDVQEQLTALLGDFYLLPSSIHEMIAINRDCVPPDSLTDMIREVNQEYVADSEILDCIPYILENGSLVPVPANKEARLA